MEKPTKNSDRVAILEQVKNGNFAKIPAEYHAYLKRKLGEFATKNLAIHDLNQLKDENSELAQSYAQKISAITHEPAFDMLKYTPEGVFAKEDMLAITDENNEIISFAGRDQTVGELGRENLRNSEIGTMYTDEKWRGHGLAQTLGAILVSYAFADQADAVIFANKNSLPVAEKLDFAKVNLEQQQEEHPVSDELLALCETDFCDTYYVREEGELCAIDNVMIKKFPHPEV